MTTLPATALDDVQVAMRLQAAEKALLVFFLHLQSCLPHHSPATFPPAAAEASCLSLADAVADDSLPAGAGEDVEAVMERLRLQAAETAALKERQARLEQDRQVNSVIPPC